MTNEETDMRKSYCFIGLLDGRNKYMIVATSQSQVADLAASIGHHISVFFVRKYMSRVDGPGSSFPRNVKTNNGDIWKQNDDRQWSVIFRGGKKV